jgi:hypothetical protein
MEAAPVTTNRAVPFALVALALCALSACASQRFDGPDGDRRFYEARCGVCHVPYPRDHMAAHEWPAVLDQMAPRAGLTASQRERVRNYLTSR